MVETLQISWSQMHHLNPVSVRTTSADKCHLLQVLVPLVNTPLLDYTLDWLERSGVDEAIVYCRAQPNADKIRQHCR